MRITIPGEGSFPLYEKVIYAILGDKMSEETFIDLCCCEATISRNFPYKEKTYVDALDCWQIPGQMNRFVQADVLGDHECFNRKYDVAFCSDGIEHLTKPQGFRLVERMKAISEKQVLFTPLGELSVETDNPDPRSHKSGWHPGDFPGFAAVVVPHYHPTLGVGAFWVWRCKDIDKDFDRVTKLLGT